MKAWITSKETGKLKLIKADVEFPAIKSNEVLIEVRSIGINPVDMQTLQGNGIAELLNFNEPVILGWDISGVIVAIGKDVTSFRTGDEVFGMVNFPGQGKAYATHVAAPAINVCIKPVNISHSEAAAACLAALTAWQAIAVNAKVRAGQKVLIHAASGGVGHYAVQIAVIRGAFVIGTSSNKNKAFVLNLGAHAHWDYTSKLEKHDEKFDLVLDSLGGENIEGSFSLVKKGGTLISLPTSISPELTAKARLFDINAYYIQVHTDADDLNQIADCLSSGALKSFVTAHYTFDQLPNALEQIATGKTQGKIVINL